MQCSVEPRRTIDEKHNVFNRVFLAEFIEKHLRECLISRRKQPYMEVLFGVRIDSSFDRILIDIEGNDIMTHIENSINDNLSHPSETDNAEFHFWSSRFSCWSRLDCFDVESTLTIRVSNTSTSPLRQKCC